MKSSKEMSGARGTTGTLSTGKNMKSDAKRSGSTNKIGTVNKNVRMIKGR